MTLFGGTYGQETTAKKAKVYNSFTDVVGSTHVLNMAFSDDSGNVVQIHLH